MNVASVSSAGSVIGARTAAIPRPSKKKFLPVAILYFFFNGVFLPFGMFYTTLLAPCFYLWLRGKRQRWITIKFLLVLAPFIVIHLRHGVDSKFYYLRSLLLLWTVYVTVYAFCYALKNARLAEYLFLTIIPINFYASIACLLLALTPMGPRLWNHNFSALEGTGYLPRLQMLCSEPSVYGLLLVPLLIYAVMRLLNGFTVGNMARCAMVLFPVLLSQSFGTITMCAAGVAVASLSKAKDLLRKREAWMILILLALLLALIAFTPNPVSTRMASVLSGKDSSTASRTFFGFLVADEVASSKSIWWGAGLGQAKLQDVSDLGVGFETAVIPNSILVTFAELGLVAVIIKLAAQVYLFFRTRVYQDSFRLAMFTAAFICQMTGSYLMNVQEYLLWFLAFCPLFAELSGQLPASTPRIKPRRLPRVLADPSHPIGFTEALHGSTTHPEATTRCVF